jgi:hypothetical protein
MRPATDQAQGGDVPAFLTEEALLRLEQGLRAAFPGSPSQEIPPQLPPPQRRPTPALRPQDAASSRPGVQALGRAEKRSADWSVASTPIEAISENPPLAPAASWRRRKVGLLLCALLLIVGVAALGVSLKARRGGSPDAVPVNPEASGRTASVPPHNDEPGQPITNAVKSTAATPPLPPLSRHRPTNNGSKRKGPPRRRSLRR